MNEQHHSLLQEIEQLNRDGLPATGQWVWVSSSVNARVAKRIDSPSVFYKAFLARNRWETIKSWVRGSRCERAVKNAETLLRCGFETPEVLISDFRGSRPWMVTRAIDAVGYGDYMVRFLRHPTVLSRLQEKHRLVRAVGTLVGTLHAHGIIHGDLRPNNILVDNSDQKLRLYLIDNERNCRYTRVPHRFVIKNLVQVTMLFGVDLNTAARGRFFEGYFKAFPCRKSHERRRIMKQVYKRVTERLKGRPVYEVVEPHSDKEA